jgi:MerR family transcriptional regulator, light-induced transcriptional regulator
MSETVSAGEAARRLGVAAATIQRWVDKGLLHAERTPGGHRRIYVTELRRLIAANRLKEQSGPVAEWLDVLFDGDPLKTRIALLTSRQRSGSWGETADEVASALAEIGRCWEAGSCQVFEEHISSEALRRAAAVCASEMHPGAGAFCATLFSIEGERHTLGLSLAELVFAEAGWRSIWIGEGPPVNELETLVARHKPHLMAVSASAASRPAPIAHYQSELIKIASSAGIQLILGGSGAWKTSRDASRIDSFQDLQALLSGGRP